MRAGTLQLARRLLAGALRVPLCFALDLPGGGLRRLEDALHAGRRCRAERGLGLDARGPSGELLHRCRQRLQMGAYSGRVVTPPDEREVTPLDALAIQLHRAQAYRTRGEPLPTANVALPPSRAVCGARRQTPPRPTP